MKVLLVALCVAFTAASFGQNNQSVLRRRVRPVDYGLLDAENGKSDFKRSQKEEEAKRLPATNPQLDAAEEGIKRQRTMIASGPYVDAAESPVDGNGSLNVYSIGAAVIAAAIVLQFVLYRLSSAE